MTNLQNLQTPALLLNMEQMNRNISDIVQFAKDYQLNYRPHIKTHKSINIAEQQLKAGAIGVTVATVGEAEIMVRGGIDDVLIAFPITLQSKFERILQLLNHAKMTIAVDSADQAKLLHEFFKKHNRKLNVWIKVNSGLNRCGVQPGAEVLQLSQYINTLDSLSLDGLFTHAGHSYTATSKTKLQQIAEQESDAIISSAHLCEQNGISITHKSIGSTPTFKFAGKIPGITEIRPGNAVFYDMVQVGLGIATKQQCALTVKATVASVKKGRAIIDAGSKALALDKGAHGNESITGHGYIIEYPNLTIERLSEEHGVIIGEGVENLNINEQLTIIPNHACTVANLFDDYRVYAGDKIIDKWPVDARGALI